jgi:glycosyltransferase involved in cell wall biosynthesis
MKGGVWLPFPAATKNPFEMALNSVRLARLIRDEEVDIVHARSRAPAWVAFYAAKQTGVRFVTTYHSAYSTASAIKLRYNGVMAAGDCVIANSRFCADRIAQFHPEATSRVQIIERGVDLRLFAPSLVDPARVARLRALWGVEPHHHVLLLPGRLSARKGHAILLEATKRLLAEGVEDLRVIFVGDAHSESFRRDIDAQISRLGLVGTVRSVGYCDDMPAAYLAAAVTVAPAIEPEAFGRVAVEAQAMGAPVIVSELGAAGETVLAPPRHQPHESTGWCVPPGDPETLAKAIQVALGMTASARDALSQRQRANAARRFSVDKMCDATLEVYERLLRD